jgi:hypothetical protein
MMAYAWNHRHEVRRWATSLWDEVTAPGPFSPGRVKQLVRVLWASSRDPELRDAKQFRGVRIVGGQVELDIDPTWRSAGRAVDRLAGSAGLSDVRLRAHTVQPPLSPSLVTTASTPAA